MNSDFKALSVKDNLNKSIWTDDNELKPEVRQRLLKIAKDFYKDLQINWAKIKDITFTGSLANYNWSEYSDIDLHLVIEFEEVDENIDFVEAYFNARKNLWNETHDISMYKFDVEVYVQDHSEPHYSSGVYSILNNEWIVKPKKEKPLIDKEAIQNKVDLISVLINKVEKVYYKKEYKEAIEQSELLGDKIKKMRKCGLENGGEFSTENLTYKLLRRKGILDRLWKIKIDAYDKMMSI